MTTHSSVLAWRIPGTGEPGGLLSLGSHRVRHDWSDLAAAATYVLLDMLVVLPRDISRSSGPNKSRNIWPMIKPILRTEGNGTPLQYFCLENPMDRGAWWAAVHGIAKESDMTEWLHFHFSLSCTGEGNGNPLQCCLGNPRDGGAWWAAVYGVAQSRTQLKRLSSSSSRGQNHVNDIIRQFKVNWFLILDLSLGTSTTVFFYRERLLHWTWSFLQDFLKFL